MEVAEVILHGLKYNRGGRIIRTQSCVAELKEGHVWAEPLERWPSNLESRPQHYFSLCGYFFQDTISLSFFRKVAFLLPRPIAGKCAPTLQNSTVPCYDSDHKERLTPCSASVLNSQGWGSNQPNLDQVLSSGSIKRGQRVRSYCTNMATVTILRIGKGGQLGFNHWDLGQYN